MRLTKRQLRRIIREEYSRLKNQGLLRESNDPYTECYNAIVRMIGQLPDAGDWWKIEDRARALCKRKGVPFSEVFADALMVFGIEY